MERIKITFELVVVLTEKYQTKCAGRDNLSKYDKPGKVS
jgi:hypothetical protein